MKGNNLALRDPYKKESDTFYDVGFDSEYFWEKTSGQNNHNEMVLAIIAN